MLRWAQIAPVCPGKPQLLGWPQGFGGYPTSRVVAIGMGTYNSLGEGKYSPQVWLQGPEPVGCVVRVVWTVV